MNVLIFHAFVFTPLNTFRVVGAVTALIDGNFFHAISTCLDTHPVDGLCYSSEYGAMPDWDTSQITSMAGCQDKSLVSGSGARVWFSWRIKRCHNYLPEPVAFVYGKIEKCNIFGSTFNGNISGWNSSGVRDMSYMLCGAVALTKIYNVETHRCRES